MGKRTIGTQRADSALEFLQGRGVQRFVHFTSLDNLASILDRGILPRAELDIESFSYHANDGLRLDGSAHINLSITHPNIPLFFKIRKAFPDRYYVVLCINPSILYEYTGERGKKSYSFRSTNAASRNSTPCNVEQLFAGQRPYGYRDEWTTDPQAEVLIPGPIPPRYIDKILLSADYKNDASRLRAIERIRAQIQAKGLSCQFVVENIVFENLRERLSKASPQEKYDQYYLSWQTTPENYDYLSSEVNKLPHVSRFDSVAVPKRDLEAILESTHSSRTDYEWTLTFIHARREMDQSNTYLTCLAVLEKILNKSRVGILSSKLENNIYDLIFSENPERETDSIWIDTYSTCIQFAHQIQCSLLELMKHGCLNKRARIAFEEIDNDCPNFGIIAELALSDLQELSRAICNLYGANNLFVQLEWATSNDCDYRILHSSRKITPEQNEAIVSSVFQPSSPVPYDPVRVQSPIKAFPTLETLKFLLHYIYGFDGFREGQYRAITKSLARQDAIVLLPTGSGKSVIFQLIALITPGTAFIISPITSLIDDQVQNLEARGIDRIIGLTGQSENKREAERSIASGQYLMCYVSPERFQIQSFINCVRNYSQHNLVSVIAVDEAHCVSEWGHDFRTSYLGLARNCREFCSTDDHIPPLLALTGTASVSVLMDMKHDLEINAPGAIIKPKSFDRPEIHYRVVRARSEEKQDVLRDIITNQLPADLGVATSRLYKPTGSKDTMSGVIFCQHINGSYGIMASEAALRSGYYGVWDTMDSMLPGCCSFYSGKAPKRISPKNWDNEKQTQALCFKRNNTSVMVATKAFGMGIDKPNIRWIIHFGIPSSLESYYQEVGRAARDKRDAYAYLILSDDYPDLNDAMLDPANTSLAKLDQMENTKEKFKGDDISRCLFFHQSTFSGVDQEMQIACMVLDRCRKENYHDKRWHLAFGSFDNADRNTIEKAIYRLTLLGVFTGYTVEYEGRGYGSFLIEPVQSSGEELRKKIIENYVAYIRTYQSDPAFLKASRQNLESAVGGIERDRDFIIHVLRHLLVNFTYKVIEEGRRRALMTILNATRNAANIADIRMAESYLRSQIVAYLTTGNETDEIGLTSILNDATNEEKLYLIIEQAIEGDTVNATSQQALRLLEDYPQHYGFYYLIAALNAQNGNLQDAAQSLKSAIHFGTDSYGLSAPDIADSFLRFMVSPLGSQIPIKTLDALAHCCAKQINVSYLSLVESLQGKKFGTIGVLHKMHPLIKSIGEKTKWTTTNILK